MTTAKIPSWIFESLKADNVTSKDNYNNYHKNKMSGIYWDKHISELNAEQLNLMANDFGLYVRWCADNQQTFYASKALIKIGALSILKYYCNLLEPHIYNGVSLMDNVESLKGICNHIESIRFLYIASGIVINDKAQFIEAMNEYIKIKNDDCRVFNILKRVHDDLCGFYMWVVYTGGTQQDKNDLMTFSQQRQMYKNKDEVGVWWIVCAVACCATLSLHDKVLKPRLIELLNERKRNGVIVDDFGFRITFNIKR